MNHHRRLAELIRRLRHMDDKFTLIFSWIKRYHSLLNNPIDERCVISSTTCPNFQMKTAQTMSITANTKKTVQISAAAVALLLSLPISAQMATPVSVDTVRTEGVTETVTVFGEVVSRQSGPVQVAISAPVSAVHVSVGDRVAQGDLIATLDSTMLELQKNTVQARIEMAEWASKRAATQLELSQQQVDRFRQLRHSAATSEAQLEDAELALKISQQALGESKAAISPIQRELAISEHNISLTKITAPYAGVVVERTIEIGQYMRTGDRAVRIVGDHELEIEAYIPYRLIDNLKVGDFVTAAFDNGTEFRTRLRAFIPEEHVSTRTRAVRFEFDQSSIDDLLAINQNVILYLPVATNKQALSVHKDAVLAQQGGYVVYVIEDDTAMQRTIEIGQAFGSRYEVISGLTEGDMTVIRGNERLTPNQKVQMIN